MSPEVYSVLILGCLAVALLVADRLYRINPFLVEEGFLGGSYKRCGVDLAPCPFGTRCINGICGNPQQLQLHDRNPLPVLPARASPNSIRPGVDHPASTLPAQWGIALPK